MTKSELEATFDMCWRLFAPPEAPDPEAEYIFHPTRKWRLDRAWPQPIGVAIEIEGGTWGQLVRCQACGAIVTRTTKGGRTYRVREAGGRHVRGKGFEDDAEKYNALAAMGYMRFTVTKTMLETDPEKIIRQIAAVVVLKDTAAALGKAAGVDELAKGFVDEIKKKGKVK